MVLGITIYRFQQDKKKTQTQTQTQQSRKTTSPVFILQKDNTR